MNSYRLNDKEQDQKFLAGNPVNGTALFAKNDFKADSIKIDERIVILLSNGKKYLGKVTRFTYVTKGNVIEGELEIVRA